MRIQPQESLNFDKVWLMFQETDKMLSEKFRETDIKFQETERLLKEQSQETDKKFQETDKRWEKKLRQLDGEFTTRWGKFIETLVSDDLINLLAKREINVNRIFPRAKVFYKKKEYEFDVIAANGAEVVVVEVKSILKIEDVREFLEKLKIFKEIFKEYKQNKIYGAAAYLHVDEEADKYAYRQGLFVIKATGKSAVITNDKKFIPKPF